MPKRQKGSLLILGGVIVALVTSAVVITGGSEATAVRSPGNLLTAACLGLLGVGVALIGLDRPISVVRSGLRILAVGLIGDSVLGGLLMLPVFDDYGILLLSIPILVIALANVIGAGVTVLALVAAGGRSRMVGAAFLAAVAAFAAHTFINDMPQTDGPPPPAIALAIVAGAALLLGFVGLALLAWGDGTVDGSAAPSLRGDDWPINID